MPCSRCPDSASQEEKKRKREKEHGDSEGEADDFDPGKKVEVEPPPDRPVRACRTQPGEWKERVWRLSWSAPARLCDTVVGVVLFCLLGTCAGRRERRFLFQGST